MSLYDRFNLLSTDALVHYYNTLRMTVGCLSDIESKRMDKEDLEIVTRILIQREVIKEVRA